jgi:uncharacterized repeat protein (TIGR01451 family)
MPVTPPNTAVPAIPGPATDQRGFSRLAGPAQDIGAFEYQYDVAASATTPTSAVPGGTITYVLTVTNNGPDPVPGVTLTDTVPDGTTFASVTGSSDFSASTPGVGRAGTVAATITSPLAAGDSATFTLVVQANAAITPGTIVNSAAFGPTTDDTNATNNIAVSTTTVSAASVASLAFVSQPANAQYWQTLGTVTVRLSDASGSVVDSSAPVTVALGNNPGNGILEGTLTVNANHGVATFTGLSVSEAGTGYTLVATSPGLSAATSSPFTVTGLASGLTVNGDVLYVVGGAGYNWVQINPTGAATDGSTGISVQATLNGQYVAQNFGPGLTTVRLYLHGSGSSVQMTPSLTLGAYISVGSGYNDIQTSNGNETILTGDGGGYITAGDGNDIIRTGNGYNVVQVSNGNDVISVGDQGSSIEAGNGNDLVLAGNGYNYVQLGNGNNVVGLGMGGGTVVLGAGNDVVAEAAPGAYVQAAGSVNVEAGPPEAVLRAALDAWFVSVGSEGNLRNDLSPWLGDLPPA